MLSSNWIRMLLPILALLSAASVLTACAGSTRPGANARIVLPALPAETAAPCPGPQALPDNGMTQSEVEQYWARDRVNLAKCRDSKGAIVTFYEDLALEFSR